jgi:hypothetical protein
VSETSPGTAGTLGGAAGSSRGDTGTTGASRDRRQSRARSSRLDNLACSTSARARTSSAEARPSAIASSAHRQRDERVERGLMHDDSLEYGLSFSSAPDRSRNPTSNRKRASRCTRRSS